MTKLELLKLIKDDKDLEMIRSLQESYHKTIEEDSLGIILQVLNSINDHMNTTKTIMFNNNMIGHMCNRIYDSLDLDINLRHRGSTLGDMGIFKEESVNLNVFDYICNKIEINFSILYGKIPLLLNNEALTEHITLINQLGINNMINNLDRTYYIFKQIKPILKKQLSDYTIDKDLYSELEYYITFRKELHETFYSDNPNNNYILTETFFNYASQQDLDNQWLIDAFDNAGFKEWLDLQIQELIWLEIGSISPDIFGNLEVLGDYWVELPMVDFSKNFDLNNVNRGFELYHPDIHIISLYDKVLSIIDNKINFSFLPQDTNIFIDDNNLDLLKELPYYVEDSTNNLNLLQELPYYEYDNDSTDNLNLLEELPYYNSDSGDNDSTDNLNLLEELPYYNFDCEDSNTDDNERKELADLFEELVREQEDSFEPSGDELKELNLELPFALLDSITDLF